MKKAVIIKTAQRIIKTCEQNNRDLLIFKQDCPEWVKLFEERNDRQIEFFKEIIEKWSK